MSSNKLNKVDLAKATISIKVLEVDNKSLSVSLLKQFAERDLIDTHTHEINGNPWGRINVVWPEIKNRRGLHILYEKEGELFRDILMPPFKKEELVSSLLDGVKFLPGWDKGIKHTRLATLKITKLYYDAIEKYQEQLQVACEQIYGGNFMETQMINIELRKRVMKQIDISELENITEEYRHTYGLLSSLDQLFI